MLLQKLSGNFPDTQETFWKLTKTLETRFGNPQALPDLRKSSGNSLGHWKHPLETLSQLLDTLGLLKILAGCSLRNSAMDVYFMSLRTLLLSQRAEVFLSVCEVLAS